MHSDVDSLADKLQHAAELGPKPLVRATPYTYPETSTDRAHEFFSWKALESAYRDFGSSTLPTLARGLFLEQRPDKHWRVAVRGYDKFFNVGELPWTSTPAIAAYSEGPYVLSYKENGCIIFIAAVSPTRLVVTSKHALYLNDPGRVSHADMGRRWLEHHLAVSGKTQEELAAELWKRDQTAVLELCDDQFEEHVLSYPPERTGLHLHGLNDNTEAFHTASMDQVAEFAQKYGFLPVRYLVKDTFADVEKFAMEVAKTGSVDGDPIEGFVVRTTMPAEVKSIPGVVAPPYAPGQTWFYKIKFDEPYLMYRQWRELARMMITSKEQWEQATKSFDEIQLTRESNTDKDGDPNEKGDQDAPELSRNQVRRERKKLYANIARRGFTVDDTGVHPPQPPRVKDNRPESLVYVKWCQDRLYGNKATGIQASPDLFERLKDGHGIIALRDQFLAYLATDEGAAELAKAKGGARNNDLREDDRPFEKTLIVPIAVPGSGKTALAVALTNLFGDWAHIQSDDVQTKRTGPTFLRNVEKSLREKNVVIADRNNHLEKHREEFVDIVRRISGIQKNGERGPRVRVVALVWRVDELPTGDVHNLLAERIVGRGDRHQCLRVGKKDAFGYDMILRRFLVEWAPFKSGGDSSADAQFSECISFSLHDPLDANLAKAIEMLQPMLGVESPGDDAIEASLEAARTYSPKVRKPVPQAAAGDPLAVHKTSYIGIFFPINVAEMAEKLVVGVDASAKAVLDRIVAVHRVVQKPHVTLVHAADLGDPDTKRRWDILFEVAKQRPSCTVHITGIAWCDRVMSLKVGSLHSDALDIPALQGPGFIPHITVGVTNANVKHIEGREILGASQQDNRDGIYFADVTAQDLVGNIEFFSNPP